MPTSRKTVCLVGLVAATLCVAVILSLALTTRYALYPDITHTDMPSDMRCVDRGTSSKFCKRHQVTARLDSESSDNSQGSNSKAEFDAYVTSKNPKETITNTTQNETLRGSKNISSWPADSFHHGFNILRGSSADVYVCSKGEGVGGFWFYTIQGYKNWTLFMDSRQTSPLKKCDGYNTGCLQSEYVTVSKNCDDEKYTSQYKKFQFEFNDTAETYYFWYVYDSPSNKSTKNSGKQAIFTVYNMEHTRYDLSLAKKTADDKSTEEMDGEQYVILDFKYYTKNINLTLNNIKVTTHCVPDLGMYMLSFLLPGLFFVALIGCITIPYAMSERKDNATLITRVTDYNIEDSGNYGSINE